MENIISIIFYFLIFIPVVLLLWFCKNYCTRKQDVPARRIGDPTPSVHGTISNRASPDLRIISLYPPKPPPLGFGNSVDIPDIGFNANDPVDTYPLTRRAPYPPQYGNNRVPYPAETSCYPPSSHRVPYPVENSIPQPSRSRISYSSDRNTRETSNSTRIAPYPSARETPYPVTSSMPQPSTSTRYEPSNSTRIIPYTPADQAAYPPSSECIIRRPSRTQYSAERSTGRTRYSERSAPRPPASSAPYPPASSASVSSELPPPTYEDAVKNKI